MEFRTEIKQIPSSISINHHSNIMMLGSCFSENIGSRLQKYKFQCKINPFGTIFNPISIAKLINRSLSDRKVNSADLTLNQDLYFHYDIHSDLSSTDPDALTTKINKTIAETSTDLKTCQVLFITLGSAFAYKHINSDEIVANCHKMPSSLFSKQLLSIESCYNALYEAFAKLIAINASVNIVLTVSPVRHTRNGIVADHRSKARLIEVSHALTESMENVSYFPSYELMMDDLRDYRYYEKDLIHPNEMAVDYIWEKFSSLFFHSDTITLNHTIEKLVNALNHRPKNIETIQHKAFITKIDEEIRSLNKVLPHLVF